MVDSHVIHIVICVDNNYVVPTTALINSICDNNKDVVLFFHVVVDGNLDVGSKSILEDALKRSRSRGTIYCFNDRVADKLPIHKENQPYHITSSAYYRLFLTDILPNTIDKVLYLDSDIIINGDISELWENDITNFAVGAIPDMDEGNLNIYRRLQYSPKLGYFNSGVLLINLRYWRENNLLKAYLEFWKDYPDRVVYHDQDILNYVLREQKKHLPLKYNVQMPALFKVVNISWEYDEQLQEALARPVVIHYTTSEKPWIKGCKHPWRSLFFKYVQQPIPKFLTKKKQSKLSFYHRARNLMISIGILKTNQAFRDDLPLL